MFSNFFFLFHDKWPRLGSDWARSPFGTVWFSIRLNDDTRRQVKGHVFDKSFLQVKKHNVLCLGTFCVSFSSRTTDIIS